MARRKRLPASSTTGPSAEEIAERGIMDLWRRGVFYYFHTDRSTAGSTSESAIDDSPYALARKRLEREFARKDAGMEKAGVPATVRLERLREFVPEAMAAIEHLPKKGEAP